MTDAAVNRSDEESEHSIPQWGAKGGSDRSVFVIGEAIVDIIEAQGQRSEHMGGSPANVALGLGRRGVPVRLLTQFGDDPRGHAIISHLEKSGVEVLRESLTRAPTSTALACLGPDGHAKYDFELSWSRFPSLDIPSSTVIHTGSVAAFLEPGADSVREIFHASDAREITFDPNIRAALLGPHHEVLEKFQDIASMCTVVKLSDEDAAWLYPGLSIHDALQTVLALGPRLAAVTLGSAGALISNAHSVIHVPATPVASVDTIGAGDAFMSSLIESVLHLGSSGLDEGALRVIGRSAALGAAITVSRPGADPPWAHELSAPLSHEVSHSPEAALEQ